MPAADRATSPSVQELKHRAVYESDPVVAGYSTWTVASKLEEEAIGLALANAGGRVVDIGSGTGRFAEHVSSRGYEYLGIDVSLAMVAKARSLHPEHDFRHHDLLDWDGDGVGFDVALFMHNGLDIIHPLERRLDAIGMIAKLLQPGGKFVYSSHKSRVRAAIGQDVAPGYSSELYHGHDVLQFRTTVGFEKHALTKAGFQLDIALDDDSREPPDWTYYIATRLAAEDDHEVQTGDHEE